MNIEQMTQKTREALQAAQRIAVEYSNNAVEQEHLLAALAQQQDGLIPQMLQTLGLLTSLRTLFKRSSNSPRYLAPATSAPMSRLNTV